ncbi:IclR family transcriptional regulator [Azospirillum brasilense]|uniref:IclR family transcriptional regulator n=1 Tax=Azospirillum brasilense TaxID=192 RepID=A0A235H408_AZOBR|nr:IclR family transcriptional regulator [Azospirillum brasilense]OYD80561.1 IclR family transcriptional regulator [Azospirillum brasilense]
MKTRSTQTPEAVTNVPDDAAKPKAAATDRTFAILELVASASGPLAVKTIGTTLGLPKPTAHRLVNGLIDKGLLARDLETRDVIIGVEAARLAVGILRASLSRAPVRSVLRAVSAELGETCNVGVLDGGDVVYLDRVEVEHWPLRLQFGVGSRVPMHCTAMGKLFLATLPDGMRSRLLASGPFSAQTAHTLTDPDALAAELERIAARGYSLDDEEYVVGVFCVAVPILSSTGRTVAAIAVQAPKVRLSHDRVEQVLPILRRGAEALSAQFG